MQKLISIVAIGGAFLLVTGCSSWWKRTPPDQKPVWVPLNIPQGSLPLPAVLVGNEKQPSGDCFSAIGARDTSRAVDKLIEEVRKKSSFDGNLKAAFEKAMVEAQVGTEVRRLLMQTWRTQIDSARIVKVDPASSVPNFSNQTCRVSDLEWFVNGRVVVTSALMADTFKVSIGRSSDASQHAQVAAAMEKLNTRLKLSFSNAVVSDKELTFSGSNVFFGVLTTELSAKQCKADLEFDAMAGESVNRRICDGKYVITTTPSAAAKRLTINVGVDGEGVETGEMDIEANRSSSQPIGANRIVSLFAEDNGSLDQKRKIKITVSVLQVGVSG